MKQHHRILTRLTFLGLAVMLTLLIYNMAGPHMGQRPEWLKLVFSGLAGAYMAYQPLRFSGIVKKARAKRQRD